MPAKRSTKSPRKSAKKGSPRKAAKRTAPAKRAPARGKGRASPAAKGGSAAAARKGSKRPAARGKEPSMRTACIATDPFGGPCQNTPRLGSKYCGVHSHLEAMA